MEWLKPKAAAKLWAGGISTEYLYRDIANGRLKCVRYGSGRNILLCEEWVTEWLLSMAEHRVAKTASGDVIALRTAGRSDG